MGGTSATTWVMAESESLGRGQYQREIVGTAFGDIVDGTQRRDVSETLDLLALADTPFINKIGWGPDAGTIAIEWISEDLGPAMVKSSWVCSTSLSFLLLSVEGIDASESAQQLKQGSVLYTWNSIQGEHFFAAVVSAPVYNAISVYVSFINGTPPNASMTTGQKWYVLGAYANEGSIPNIPGPRKRVVCSNTFSILRQDVQITGTMKSEDMYAVGREDRHQVLMRLKELQRERERAALYSIQYGKTSLQAGLMNGMYGFLSQTSGDHIDESTYTLTESAVNTVVTKVWENGGRNLTFFGHIDQCAKFTRWDKNRIRTRVNDGKGGGYITSYLTESGIVIDLVPMAYVPTNLAFIVDTSKVQLRAKKGRKAIMEKLGKMGDFDDWQILSEFSMECKGWNIRQHGMFTKLI